MKTASLVITYNGAKTIFDTITGLLKNELCDKIFVFDNNSTDDTLNILKNLKNDKIILIKNPENIGIGKALNVAIKEYILGKYDFVLLSDQDTSFVDNAVDTLTNFFKNLLKKNESVGAVCGISRNRKYNDLIYSPYLWKGSMFSTIDVSACDEQYIKIGSNIMSGTMYLVKVIEETGYFNEEYFIDFVDHEFNYRMTKNFDFFMLNKTLIFHDLGKNTIKTKDGFFFEHNPSRYYYMARNMTNFYLKENGLDFLIEIFKFHDSEMKEYSQNYQEYCRYRNKGIYDGLISGFETKIY